MPEFDTAWIAGHNWYRCRRCLHIFRALDDVGSHYCVATTQATKPEAGVIYPVTSEDEFIALTREPMALVFYHTPWCEHSQAARINVERLSNENPDLKVATINADAEKNLALRLFVKSVPTLFFIRHGELVERFVGPPTLDDLRKTLARLRATNFLMPAERVFVPPPAGPA